MSSKESEPNLIFVELIHQALRIDGARLLATVSALEPDDPAARAAGAEAFFAAYRAQLVAHHTHEDTLFFPALAARIGEQQMHLPELVAQHDELETVLAAVGDGFAGLTDPSADFAASRARTVDALAAMVEHLTMHLDFEERTALPLFRAHMPAAEMEHIEAQVRKATPREESAFMLPWIAEHASPAQRKQLFRAAPPLRIVVPLNRRRYRKLDAALLPAA